MPSKKRSFRSVTRIALVGVIAAVAMSVTVIGVGAKPVSFIQSLQGYLNAAPGNDGGSDQMATINLNPVETPTTCTNGSAVDGSTEAPSATCPLTVLPGGGGTSTNARAPSTRFAASRAVYLIRASELAAAGYAPGQVPTTIGWNYSTAPGVSGAAPLKVYLQNTTDTTFSKTTSFTSATTGMTKVHDATTTLPSTIGAFDITLSGGAPFTYTGGGIYVAFDWGPYTGTLSTTAAILCNTSLPGGLEGANSTTDTLAVSDFRPETRLSSSIQNDAGVTAIYSYGELPKGKVGPQTIKAVIINNGATALTNVSVTLNITGADSFTDTQTIASLGTCGATAVVTFAPFTPGLGGNDTIQVTVPADDVSTNNSRSQPLYITAGSYSYKVPGTTASGGVGFTGASGALVAKFTTSVATKITDVKLEFPAATATTYKVAIYGDNGGVPSTTALYVDAANRTVSAAGPIVISLPAPVSVGPGNFYVGIQQTGTVNVGLGYDVESPIRSGSFFIAGALPVASWTDESPGNSFKLNIGIQLQGKARADFDADGKTDVSVFRPSEGNWYENNSTSGFTAVHWGTSGDVPMPGDYDGDGKTDVAVWRPSNAPGVADYYVLNSSDSTVTGISHGTTTDIPVAGGDYDGDGKTDYAVFRPSTGYWYVLNSADLSATAIQFGATGDVPLAMDPDGDGKANVAVFRPTDNTWYIARPTGQPGTSFNAIPFGTAGDLVVPADYDGDSRDDVAVFRPSTGTWYILRSRDGSVTITQFGASGDVPAQGDYDGDGKADVAVYRGGVWYINRSTTGFAAVNFGVASDIPVPAKYNP
jgi:FG-GAP-like repeat